jgi:hypothetical protein
MTAGKENIHGAIDGGIALGPQQRCFLKQGISFGCDVSDLLKEIGETRVDNAILSTQAVWRAERRLEV